MSILDAMRRAYGDEFRETETIVLVEYLRLSSGGPSTPKEVALAVSPWEAVLDQTFTDRGSTGLSLFSLGQGERPLQDAMDYGVEEGYLAEIKSANDLRPYYAPQYRLTAYGQSRFKRGFWAVHPSLPAS